MSRYVTLDSGNEAELDLGSGDNRVWVCEENGAFGREYTCFTKQDILDMLNLFQEQEQENK